MAKLPWMKFYPTHWRDDEALQLCSLATKGLWIEMICIMDRATPRGYLLVKGKTINEKQLARLAGCSVEEAESCINELEDNGVFSRDKARKIYSRKIVFEEKKKRIARENGKKGGNPTLCNKDTITPLDNPTLKPKSKEVRGKSIDSKKTIVKKRGSQITEYWRPKNGLEEFAKKNSFDFGMVAYERLKFVDYFLSKGEPRKDWDAGFRNWMRNAKDWNKPNGKSTNATDSLNAAILDFATDGADDGGFYEADRMEITTLDNSEGDACSENGVRRLAAPRDDS